MHRLFKPKTIRRMLVFAAMMAPAVYLFGSQFFALAGAHGEPILEDTSYVIRSYDELMTPENFSYGAFDWTNTHGTHYGFSLGYLTLNLADINDGIFNYIIIASDYGTALYTESNAVDYGLGFTGNTENYFSVNLYGEYNEEDFLEWDEWTQAKIYTCFYQILDNGFVLAYTIECEDQNMSRYEYNPSTQVWTLRSETRTLQDLVFMRDYPILYFDDGAHLPDGVTWNDTLASYFVPSVKPVEVVSYPVTLFGSMFSSDNFLVEWGENAISESPRGFAPFGYFWRYIDDNMLHLSDDQMGLMAYGYMYYAGHVLLFDVGFILVTFFLSFIQRMADRFGGDA